MGTYPFSAFNSILDRYEVKFYGKAASIIKGAAIEGGKVAARNTRVDTGLARSNWNARIGTPNFSLHPPYAPGHKLGEDETKNLIGTLTQHRGVVLRWKPLTGIPLFIVNSVEYIYLLEVGVHGPPMNMLRMCIQAAVAYARRRGSGN